MNNELIQQDNPQSLISLAIEKGVAIEQLEKLLALKERYDEVQANKSFIAAMSNFQKEVPTIDKKKLVSFPNSRGSITNYKYAELGEIDETIKSPMAANGLSKRWEIKEEGEKLICTCIISHIGGHKELTSMSSIKDSSGGKNEIQSRASAISYLQRYTLIGALGLTTASEDNDADGTPAATGHINNNTYQEDTREWLSESKFNETLAEIKKGNKEILSYVINEFKMKKAYKEALQSAKEEKKDEPFVVPGHWHAKMEKCKSKKDILDVYNSNRATIDASPELQKLLKETQNSLTPQLS